VSGLGFALRAGVRGDAGFGVSTRLASVELPAGHGDQKGDEESLSHGRGVRAVSDAAGWFSFREARSYATDASQKP
jgi:hypothetical protein